MLILQVNTYHNPQPDAAAYSYSFNCQILKAIFNKRESVKKMKCEKSLFPLRLQVVTKTSATANFLKFFEEL